MISPPSSDVLWQQLMKSAVLGTGRSPAPGCAEASSSDLGSLLTQVKKESPEATLLGQAAIVSTYERGGLVLEAAQEPPLAECEADALPRCSSSAAAYLRLLLGDQYPFLLPEFLGALQTASQRVPEELLAGLLEKAKKDAQLRPALGAVIGRRGHWLASLNSDWAFIGSAIAPADWETGTRTGRVELLRRLRAEDPAHARTLVQSTWATDSPDDRVAFLREFEAGLSQEDESFLEAVLDDRRKETRQRALEMLMRLPHSALVERQWRRISSLVRLKKASGITKLLVKPTMEIDLPDRWEDSMRHDGIEEKPPQGVGEKAWWLQQMARAVPPERWESHLQLSPEKCVAAFHDSEFNSALLPAIAESVIRHRDGRWAKPVVDIAIGGARDSGPVPTAGAPWSKLLETVVALDERDRDATVIKLLDQHGQMAEAALGLKLLNFCPGPWSQALARSFVKLLREITKQMAEAKQFPLWTVLGDSTVLGMRMPVSMAEEAQQSWPEDDANQAFLRPVRAIMDIVQFRGKMLKEILQ